MNHAWVLDKREAGSKLYVCLRCGAGPVRIPETLGKANITKAGKKQGIDADCRIEMVRAVHEDR